MGVKPWWSFLIGSALFFSLTFPAAAAVFDHSLYDNVLRHYVDEEGRVDYPAIRNNSLTALESYFERLGDANMAGWSDSEKLAFWINAYNARVIYLVAQKPGLKKISEDWGLFNRPFKVAGRTLSLSDIEHRILRGTVNKENGLGPIGGLSFVKVDPRVHFALVNGSLGSPPLRNQAYTAENVDATLQVNAAAFANSYKYVGVENDRLRLSSLLKWYADDFKGVGGVQAYLISLLTPDQGGDAHAVSQLLKTAYKKSLYTFDWTVNRQNNVAFKQPRHAPSADEIPPDAFSLNHPSTK